MNSQNVHDRFFPLPNDIFILGLTAGEVAVYSYLSYCEDRRTYKCHPSYKTIGKSVCGQICGQEDFDADLTR